MSQLIKKLKATQSQNTFVTPEAAAKIISSSGRKSKRNYRTFWSIVLMTIIGIGGCCFLGVKKKSVQQVQDVQLPVAPKIKIALEPLQVSPKEPLKLEDSYEAFVSSVESTNTHKITMTAKVVNTALLGLFGTKRNKQLHCDSCGSEW